MSDWLDDADNVLAHEEAQAEKRADATTWKPHTNDKHPQTLKGRLIDGDIASTEYGDNGVLTIEDGDAQVWTVWCGGALLKSALTENAPKVGTGIIIKHGGLRQPKNPGGREYRMYTMACEASDFEYWKQRWVSLKAAKDEATTGYMGGDSGVAADELEAPY